MAWQQRLLSTLFWHHDEDEDGDGGVDDNNDDGVDDNDDGGVDGGVDDNDDDGVDDADDRSCGNNMLKMRMVMTNKANAYFF